MNKLNFHVKSHHHYTLFSVGAEYLLTFSLHMLPTLHLSRLSKVMGIGTFIVYTLVSANFFRRTLAENKSEANNQ